MKTLTKYTDSINEAQCPLFPCWSIWPAFTSNLDFSHNVFHTASSFPLCFILSAFSLLVYPGPLVPYLVYMVRLTPIYTNDKFWAFSNGMSFKFDENSI